MHKRIDVMPFGTDKLCNNAVLGLEVLVLVLVLPEGGCGL